MPLRNVKKYQLYKKGKVLEMTDYQKSQLYLATQIYDKYVASDDVNYKNNGLATLMTMMESIFEIPLLNESFTAWALDNPEVAELYRKVSYARDFNFLPDADDDNPFVTIVATYTADGIKQRRNIVVYTLREFIVMVTVLYDTYGDFSFCVDGDITLLRYA